MFYIVDEILQNVAMMIRKFWRVGGTPYFCVFWFWDDNKIFKILPLPFFILSGRAASEAHYIFLLGRFVVWWEISSEWMCLMHVEWLMPLLGRNDDFTWFSLPGFSDGWLRSTFTCKQSLSIFGLQFLAMKWLCTSYGLLGFSDDSWLWSDFQPWLLVVAFWASVMTPGYEVTWQPLVVKVMAFWASAM